MTASAPRSITLARKTSAPTTLHAVGELFTGRIIAILKDENKPDAVPHAFLLKFADSIAYLPARSLKCIGPDRQEVMKKALLGDTFDIMITSLKGTPDKPRYEASELRAEALKVARGRIGELVTVSVLSIEQGGVLVRFEKGLPGFIDTDELGSNDQVKRLTTLKRGNQLKAVIQNVTVDTLKPEILHYELSELVADLRKAAEKVGERIKPTIVGHNDSGLKLVLPNGVHVLLAFKDFNGMPLDDLKIGDSLEVVITGTAGTALSVTWKAK